MKTTAALLLGLFFASGCQPSAICSTPTESPCASGCTAIPTYRDNGACYADQPHFCIREHVIFRHLNRCVIDASGERLIVWETFDMEELFDQGWRECTQEEFTTFPEARCE